MRRLGTALSRLQLGPKIAMAVGGVLLLSTTILSTVAVYDGARLRAYLESSHNETFLPYQQLQAINDALERTEVALLAGTGMTPSQWQAKRLVIDQERLLIRAGLSRYETGLTLGAQPEMRALLQLYGVLDEHVTREQNALRVLTSELPRLDGVIDTVSRLAAGGDGAAARATYGESAAPVFERMIAATSVLMAMQFEESDLAAKAGQAVVQRTAWSIVLAVVLTLVLALVTIFWFAHHLTSPLRALVRGTRAVQRGDLSQTVAVTTQDEIGVLATAFNQMTLAVRAERDRAQRYLDTAAVILLALDDQGRITLANRYACSVLGWTADELQGRSWIDTCVPLRLRATMGQHFYNLVGGNLEVIENPVLTRSGQERLIEWRNTLLRDDTGEVIGTFSSGTDVTERNQAVAALRTAEARTRFALEAAQVGIWDIDFTTGVLQWSAILESQYGMQPGTFGGTMDAFVARIHPDDRASTLETIGAAMKTGADFTVQNRTLWPDGTVRRVSGAGRIHLGEDGAPVRGVGISLDVTDLRTEQLRVVRMTMRTVQDIVGNALMSLQLFRLDAEHHVSAVSLKLFDRVIDETAGKLKALGDLNHVVESDMVMGPGIRYQ